METTSQLIIATLCFLLFVEIAYILAHISKEGENLETLKVKYLADIFPLCKTVNGDWIDLRCAEDTAIREGEYRAIPLGVAIKLPTGYEALIVPRSSLFRHHGLICPNSIGVIDESYCGDNDEWHFLGYATRDTIIKKNERICQFRIAKHQPWMDFEKVAALDAPDRGGIGSSGRM